MVVAQRWLDQSPWYRGSMVYGACITVYLIALSTAATIYLRVRTHLYLTLLLIVICSMLDVTFNAFDDNNMPGLTPLRSVWYIISWLGCVGFSVHNFARFCALVQTRHVVLKIALVLWILLSISLYTLATVNCYRQALDSYSSMMGNWNDQYFVGLVWEAVDSVLNCTISASFVRELSRSISGHGAFELRPGYNRLIWRVEFQLAFECALMCTIMAIAIIYPDFDPLNLTYSFCQAFRLVAYSNFLAALLKTLRPPAPSGTIQLSRTVLYPVSRLGAAVKSVAPEEDN